MSLDDPIAGKRLIDQNVLISIFIAYLKLQLQKDLEKKVRNPQYIPQYRQEDIEEVITNVGLGICSGFSAFLGHKLMRGKLNETIAEIETLKVLNKIGFNQDETFKDDGDFLINQGKKPGTPEGEELNRKYNPMVALLEDILSNMRWLQSFPGIPFRDIWDEYELATKKNKEFISILSAEVIEKKTLIAFCLEAFQMESSINPGILDKEKMNKLKSIFQKSGEKAALRYLDHVLNGELERAVRKTKDIRTTVMQTEWDKLINFVTGEKTPKLQHNFSINFVFKKEEIEKIIKEVLSSLGSTKLIRLRHPNHIVLLYKEGENYYFSDPNDGKLLGPYTSMASKEIASLVFKLYSEDTTNFNFGIEVFGDPISSKFDKPLDAGKIISEILKNREATYGENFLELISSDSFNVTSLHLAAYYGDLKAAQQLLINKADLTAKSSMGFTPLHFAAQEGHLNVMLELLKRGANIEATSFTRYTALHVAAQVGRLDVVQVLLKNKANIAATTLEGYTALDLAACFGHPEVVQALLDADINSNNDIKKTALQLAKDFEQTEIVKIIESHLQQQLPIVPTPPPISAKPQSSGKTQRLVDQFQNYIDEQNKEKQPKAYKRSKGIKPSPSKPEKS